MRGTLKKIILGLLGLITLAGAALIFHFFKLGSESQKQSVSIGLNTEGKFLPCPSSPNCVSSDEKPENIYSSFPTLETELKSLDVFRTHLEKMGMEIHTTEPDYIYATATSKIFGFVDDIEIRLVDGRLHFKSKSRVGHSDLGANRKRIEKIISLTIK